MKKLFIVFYLFISLFVLSSCKEETIIFDKSNPVPIIINIDGQLKEITVVSTDKSIKDNITQFDDILEEDTITLGSIFFSNYSANTYKITISAKKTQKIVVKVIGNDAEFNMIRKKDVFNVDSNRYYILFSRDGCANCATLRPDLIIFNNFLNSYPEGMLDPLYIVDYKDPEFETSVGTSTDYTGISTYEELINNVSLSTPTLMVIENGAVLDYYINAANISAFMYIEMNNIKSSCIVHNIDEPKEIKIPLDFTPTKYRVSSSENEGSFYKVKEYDGKSVGFDGTNMVFSQYYFNSYYPGVYKVSLSDTKTQKDITVIIKSIFNYISITDIFDQKEESYYVFFLKDGCRGCASVKPTLLKYAQYYDRYDSDQNYPIYAIHRSMNPKMNFVSSEADEYFVGAKEYSEIALGFYPRVVLVSNHEIIEVYKGDTTPILTHFNSVMSKTK